MKILVLLGFIFSVQTACQNTLSFPETKDSVELMYCDSNMIIQRDQSIEESISWFQNNRELPEDTVDNRIDGYVQRNQDWFALLDQKEKGSEFSPFDANGKIYIERVIKAGEVDTNGEKYKVDTRVVTSCGINLLDGEEYAVTSSHCLTDAGYKQGDDLVDDVDNKLRASRYKISFGFGRESKEYNGKKLVEGPKGWQHLEDRPQYKHFRDIQSGDKE